MKSRPREIPVHPIQMKDIVFFKPDKAVAKPPSEIVYLYSPFPSVSLNSQLNRLCTSGRFFMVMGNRLATTRRRKCCSSSLTLSAGDELRSREGTRVSTLSSDIGIFNRHTKWNTATNAWQGDDIADRTGLRSRRGNRSNWEACGPLRRRPASRVCPET